MTGRILTFDPTCGAGKLITQDKQRFDFSVDIWEDFECVPNVGMLVACRMENGALVGLESTVLAATQAVQSQNIALPEPQKVPEPVAQIIEQPQQIKQPQIEPEQKQEASQEQKEGERNSEYSAHFPLRLSQSVADCIEVYFQFLKKIIKTNDDYVYQSRVLDYLKIKRFLMTAYNNLYELDREFFDDKLQTMKSELLRLGKVYDDFRAKRSYPKVAYENVFLNKQEFYKKAKSDLEIKTTMMNSFVAIEKSTRDELQEKEKVYIKLMNSHTKEVERLGDEVKLLKKKDVDLIHKIGILKEEIALIAKLTNEFAEKYYDSFAREFQNYSDIYDKDLLQIMSARAYELDYFLWQKAKESLIVRSFFKDSGIIEEYSSKTFLKYFLRSLDTTKMSPENKELYELLKYLETLALKKVLVLCEDSSRVMDIRTMISNISRDYSVQAYTRAPEALKYCEKNILDMLVVEVENRMMNGIEFARKYVQGKGKEAEFTTICLLAESYSKDDVIKAGKLGIKHLFLKSIKEDEFVSKLREILK